MSQQEATLVIGDGSIRPGRYTSYLQFDSGGPASPLCDSLAVLYPLIKQAGWILVPNSQVDYPTGRYRRVP